MAELDWKIIDEAAGAEMMPADCLSAFMGDWNDYTQGLRNSGPSRLYRYLDPRTIPSAFNFATQLLGLSTSKKKEKKRMLLAVVQIRTAIENFRHLKNIGVFPTEEWSVPFWKYLSQYYYKKVQAFLETYAKENDLDIFPKDNLD